MNRRALVAHLLVPFLVAVSACGSDPDAGTHADGGAGGTNQAGGAEGTEQAGSAGSSSGGGGGISGLPEEVRDELVTMADGVKLRTRVYLPANIPPGGLPVLLEREPYGFVDTTYAGFLARMGTFWNSQRYIFVYQDVRGRYGSEGEFDPFNIEVAKQDGVATTVWIDEQPWSNGRLATIGGSYSGTTAIAAAANNPLVDVVIADDYIEGFKYEILGGQHSLHTLNWARYLDSNMWMVDQVFFKLGDTFELTNLDETTLGHPFAPWSALLTATGEDDPYVKAHSMDSLYDELCVPIMHVRSDLGIGPIQGWQQIRARGCAEQRDSQTLVLTPDEHTEHFGTLGERSTSVNRLMLDTLSRYLQDLPGIGTTNPPPVLFTTVGNETLFSAEKWPAGDGEIELHLHNPPTINQMGALAETVAVDGREQTLALDPEHQSACANDATGYPVIMYSWTPPQETWIAGAVEVDLWVSSTSPDADLVVFLLDYDAATEGIEYVHFAPLRLRNRSGMSNPEPLESDTPIKVTLTLTGKAHRLRTDRQLLLRVSNALCGSVENTLTNEALTEQTRWGTADFTVLSDAEHPSVLRLPVLTEAPVSWTTGGTSESSNGGADSEDTDRALPAPQAESGANPWHDIRRVVGRAPAALSADGWPAPASAPRAP